MDVRYCSDSLALAVEAAKTSTDIIVLCGVHFMAETAKLMSSKKVLIPDMDAGCSLAASLTEKDVRLLKTISRCSSCIIRKHLSRSES